MTSVPVKQGSQRSVRLRVRPCRDFAAMEERRMQPADLFEQGVTPADIARRLGVWHQIVSDWRNVWRRSGRDGLRAAGRAGRLPKVSQEQLDEVETELAKGAEANGYPNDVWTLQRVAESSSARLACSTTQREYGTSCDTTSAGVGSDPRGVPRNAKTRPSISGSRSTEMCISARVTGCVGAK
jgi:transposase